MTIVKVQNSLHVLVLLLLDVSYALTQRHGTDGERERERHTAREEQKLQKNVRQDGVFN
jgi:hypothetical protein